MTDPMTMRDQVGREYGGPWTKRLMMFLRIMAGFAMCKGLYHWAVVVGIGSPAGSSFETNASAWQTATIFFAVIDLVAAVGLWLAAAWGGVVWLTSAISMIAVELLFPKIFGGEILVVLLELVAIIVYVVFAIAAARERPN